MTNSITEAHVPTRDVQNSFEMGRDTASTCYLVGVMLMFSGGGGGGIPSNYLVSIQLQFWLFCCWGCGCCWAVTIRLEEKGVVLFSICPKVFFLF